MTDTPTPSPVVVRADPTREAAIQTLRVLLIGLFAILADRFMQHDATTAAFLGVSGAIAGFLATYLVGIVTFLRQHAKLRFLAERAPDSVATVK